MQRKKQFIAPTWLMWEGGEFPRKLHSDSVILFISEHLYLDTDEVAKKSLARQLQREGLVESLGEAYTMINSGIETRAGYYYEDGDELFPVYAEYDDIELEYDATFVEVPYVI